MRDWKDFVNDDQYDWVNEQLKDFNVLVVSLHGPHLCGLDREGSDVDIKAVYVPTFEDLLFGVSIKTSNRKNDELDIEIEIKSLPSFLKSAKGCDTNCIDLLWTPPSMILEKDPIWDDIKSYRYKLLSKNMKGLIGYIKTHTHKYSNKIQRFQEITTLAEEISVIKDHIKLSETTLPEIVKRNNFKYIKFVTQVSDHEQKYIEVCGKKYILSWECKLLKEALEAEIQRYGDRTKEGDKKGLDTKSLSHALRVLVELKELVLHQSIEFPLQDADYIRQVKKGEINNEKEVIGKIDSLFEECTKLLEESDLPEESSIDEMLLILKELYKGE